MSRRLGGSAGTGLVLSALAVAAGAGQAAAGGERLAMSYTCAKPGSRVTVSPSAPRTFELQGPHEVRRVPLCGLPGRVAGTVRCRTLEFHRFDILCGKKRVSWSEVAAAIALRGGSRPVPPRVDDRPSCSLLPPGESHASTTMLCRWRSPAGQTWRGLALRVLAPAGFAPVAEAGGHLLGSARSTTAERPTKPGVMHTLVTSSPLPDITPAVPPAPQASTPAPAAGPPPAAEVTDRHSAGPAIFIVAFIALVASAGAAIRRWPQKARRAKAIAAATALRMIEFAERSGTGLSTSIARLPRLPFASRLVPFRQPSDLKAANAATAVQAMLTDTATRVAELRSAGPLAEVLNQEIAQFGQRLATLRTAAAENEDGATRASPGFRNLLRDIERVRRIADSAAITMGTGRSHSRIPRTKSEAYDLLGLNPDAPEGTLKKVADGLRMSWHPDHAKDDADRAQREARIKAINIAVELINGKRAA